GKPLIFGKDKDKAIALNGLAPQIVKVADTPADKLLMHDEKSAEPALGFLLSRLRYPDFPEPMGIFRDVEAPTYDGIVWNQRAESLKQRGQGDLQKLLRGPDTWNVG
ncbi:MAG: 2-oxoacid:ferredoxin oxidoreductase subunit beta, partial [Phycisphaerae bacterium]